MRTFSTAKSTTSVANVEEVLGHLGIEVVGGDREISARCPFHSDRHPSFSINRFSGLWICFQCGRKGSLEYLVQEISGKPLGQSWLREVKYERVRRRRVVHEQPEPEPLVPAGALLAAQYAQYRLPSAAACGDRQFDVAAAERYGVRWHHGWVLPISAPTRTGHWSDLWGWQIKRVGFVSNYPPGVSKSETLFGLEHAGHETVTLVESPLDAVRLGHLGISAVASFGAFVSRAQRGLLIDRFDRVLIALDGDREGRQQAKANYRELSRRISATLMRYPEGAKDPGDMTDDEVLRMWGRR